GPRGPWASIRTQSYQYTEYYSDNATTVDEREYYDLSADPFQLTNLFGDASRKNDPFIGSLAAELRDVRRCAGSDCVALLQRPGIASRCPGGAKGAHHLVGSSENDRMAGIAGVDVACGKAGQDKINGAGGRDRLLGGAGSDVISGGPGNDLLLGQGGRDLCRGGSGRDRYRGCERREEGGGKKP
ncbi:MAG TPA: hypothetical protein VG602_05380, partial [Actinomycetota bacterium]|nr:hypothetical protein [Actinomycetota bacterium]